VTSVHPGLPPLQQAQPRPPVLPRSTGVTTGLTETYPVGPGRLVLRVLLGSGGYLCEGGVCWCGRCPAIEGHPPDRSPGKTG
jgi:hypothetical protein